MNVVVLMAAMHPDYGDVPTWIGAVATIAAAGVALAIFGGSVRDRRRDQARRVAGLVPGGLSIIPPGQPLFTHGSLRVAAPAAVATRQHVQCLVHVKNGSDEVISDVTATVVSRDGSPIGLAPFSWVDIGPGQLIEITAAQVDPGGVSSNVRLLLEFTDAAGRRWRRLGGSLKRMKLSASAADEARPAPDAA